MDPFKESQVGRHTGLRDADQPEFGTVLKVLHALGLKITLQPDIAHYSSDVRSK